MNSEKDLDKAFRILHDDIYRFKHNWYKKYICLGFGIILALTLAFPAVEFLPLMTMALYYRTGLDEVAEYNFGDRYFKDIAVDELLVNSYDYNHNAPKFFSRFFAEWDPPRFDRKIFQAVAASSSAPIYFDPRSDIDGYGFKENLIDGGVICNNPSLYAYMMASYLKNKRNLRLLSLGTGE